MARNVGWTMTFTFQGVDRLSPAANSAEKSTRRMGAAIKQTSDQGRAGLQALAGAYNALIVAQRAARWMGAALAPAMAMETAVNRLKVTTGLAAHQVDTLADAARKAASVTPFAPPEAVEVATQLNLVLRDVNQTAAALIPTTSLAATHMNKDFNAAAIMATRIAGGFDTRVEGLADKLDQLAAVSRATGARINDMQGGFKRLGLTAFRMGTDFKDVIKTFALATREGLPASMAATGMLTGVGRLTTSKVQGGLSAMGVSVEDNNGRFRSMTNILSQLYGKMNELGRRSTSFQGMMKAAFGDRAVKPWLAALDQMRKGVKTTTGEVLYGTDIFKMQDAAIAKSSGLLEAQTREAMMPLSEQIKLLRESIGILLETAFRPMLAVLTPVVSWLKRAALAISEFLKHSPIISKVVAAIAKFGGILMSVLVVIFSVAAAAKVLGAAFMFLGQTAAAGGLSGRLAGLVIGFKTTQVEVWKTYRATQAQDMAWIRSMQVGGMVRGSTALTAKAMLTMKNAVMAAGASVRGLVRSFGPLLIIQGLFSWLKLFGVDPFGGGGDVDINKMMRDVEKAGRAAVKQQTVEDKANREFADNVDMLGDAIKDWTKLQKLKFPMPAFEGLKKFSSLIPLIGKAPGMGAKGVQQMENWVATVTRVQKAMSDPKIKVKRDELLKAQFATGQLMNIVKMFQPTNKRLIDSLKALGGDMGKGAQGSEEFKNTLVKLHFKENELVDAQQKIIDGTTAEVTARKQLLDVQRLNLLMFIMMTKGPESQKMIKALKTVGGGKAGLAGISTERLVEGAARAGSRRPQVEAAQAEVTRMAKAVDDMTGTISTTKEGEIEVSDILPAFDRWFMGTVQPGAKKAREQMLLEAQSRLAHELSLVKNSKTVTGNVRQTEKAMGALGKRLKDEQDVLAQITEAVVPVLGAKRPGSAVPTTGAVKPGSTAPSGGGSPTAALNQIAASTQATAKAMAKKSVTNVSAKLAIGDAQYDLLVDKVAADARGRKKAHEGP